MCNEKIGAKDFAPTLMVANGFNVVNSKMLNKEEKEKESADIRVRMNSRIKIRTCMSLRERKKRSKER